MKDDLYDKQEFATKELEVMNLKTNGVIQHLMIENDCLVLQISRY